MSVLNSARTLGAPPLSHADFPTLGLLASFRDQTHHRTVQPLSFPLVPVTLWPRGAFPGSFQLALTAGNPGNLPSPLGAIRASCVHGHGHRSPFWPSTLNLSL